MIINFEFDLVFRSSLSGVAIAKEKATIEDLADGGQRWKMSLDIGTANSAKSSIVLLHIKNFRDTKDIILIKNVKINQKDLKNESQDYFDFEMNNGEIIQKAHEICVDGQLKFNIARVKSRLFWCPWYYSSKTDDFTFDNRLLEEFSLPADQIPWNIEGNIGKKNYHNQPHHDYDTDKNYEIGCFGCSITYGSALRRSEIWPNLLHPNNLNLGVPGLGIDGIFYNLKNAIEKFKWKKTFILLPNFDRKLLKIDIPDFGHTRIPVTAGDGREWMTEWSQTDFKHWAWEMLSRNTSKDFMKIWKNQYNKIFLEILQDEVENYSIEYLEKIIKLCQDNHLDVYYGTWNEEVFEWLGENIEYKKKLPFFKTIDKAQDRRHPGPASHKRWVDAVKQQLS